MDRLGTVASRGTWPEIAIEAGQMDVAEQQTDQPAQGGEIAPDEALPKLPVARAVWIPRPDLPTAAAAWILAGGAHHTGFSQAVTSEHLEDFAEMAGLEYLLIDGDVKLADFKKELRWNEMYYHLAQGLGV